MLKMWIFSRVLRDSTPRYVRPSVGPHFTFFMFLRSLDSLLLPKYGPCPPARDWGSRVSGLVIVKGSKMWLVSSERSFEKLSEAHEF